MKFLWPLLFALPLLLSAQGSPPGTQETNPTGRISVEDGSGGMKEHNPAQLRMLEHLLQAPPEQLARLRQAIARIEAMDEAQKEALLKRIREFRQAPEERREHLRREISHIPQDERSLLRAWFAQMSPQERRRTFAEMRGLDPEAREAKRQEWVQRARDAGLSPEDAPPLPPPPPGHPEGPPEDFPHDPPPARP